MPDLNARTIELNHDELQHDVLTLASGQRFWYSDYYAHYSRITSQSAVTTRYIDADERPGDNSHDGNGWTEKVRKYTVQDDATPEEIAELDALRIDRFTRSFTEPRLKTEPSWDDEPQERKARIYQECTVTTVEGLRREIPGYLGPRLLENPYGPYIPLPAPAEPDDQSDWETL